MITLEKILKGTNPTKIIGNQDITITSICIDSRESVSGSLFAALVGTNIDGHRHIDDAIKSGATAVVCQVIPENINPQAVYIQVADSSEAIGVIASNFYGNPSQKLKLVGVTGTNGKTTTASLLYDVFRSMMTPAGLFSTIKILINDKEYPAPHTTPVSIELNRIMAQMVDDDCEYCFMEVSSHSVEQKRIAGLTFAGGIFTNITQDHLDYHKTMEQYIRAKQKFFDKLPQTAFALTNIDDKNGNIMLQNTKAKRFTYALKRLADYKSRIISKEMEGMLLEFDGSEFWTPLIGEFNAYNMLAVYATLMILGFEKEETLTVLSNLRPVKGRFERYRSESGIYVIVDYAHTPDAVANVLTTINDIRLGSERVFTVIGAGGDRDKTKRPLMAKEAARYSDILILTSDNPRSESPEVIIEEMKQGLTGNINCTFFTIPDRKEAIKVACTMAVKGDIVLIAGKGHETYQEIQGKRFPFDDMSIAVDFLK